MRLESLREIAVKTKSDLGELQFRDVLLPAEFKSKYKIKRELEGEKITWEKYTSRVVTSGSNQKNIYIPNYWFYLAVKLSLFILEIVKHRNIFLQIFKGRNLQSIAGDLRNGKIEMYREDIDSFFLDQGYSEAEKNNFIECITNYDSWGGAKTIDRSDCYYSAVLDLGNLLAESHGRVPKIAYHLYEDEELLSLLKHSFSQLDNEIINTPKLLINLPISKPFILLAGISGTGKTRFVREQAEAVGSIDKNYKLIPVRPDWHEPSDLLGYITRLTEEKYIVTTALQFMVSAWIDACDYLSTNKTNLANRPPAEMTPFWLCLDEMNLAPVEQYFADYLSVMETRKWDGDRYTCDPILSADIINLLGETAKNSLRSELGMAAEEHDPLWAYFSEVGIPLPPNLIVAGTVNMDETTHGFSRKVIDRALTLDFGQFFPNDFDAFFKPTSAPVIFSFPAISHAKQSDFNDVPADPDGQKSLDFLKGINQILKGSMFELAYRALNELFISVACIKPKDEIELQAVWDDFLMTKVLPRIEGDDDKLKNNNLVGDKNIIEDLDEYIKSILNEFYETGYRPDFFRKNIENNEPIPILCRSKKKLSWMIARLKNNGFTTFWP
jgi:hypothetical protein